VPRPVPICPNLPGAVKPANVRGMAKLEIGLYVSAVAGHHVTRYGTTTLIGATVDLDHPGNLRFDPDFVAAIPLAEYLAYKREYDRLIADGALKKRTPEEFDAFIKARAAAIDKAAAEAKEKAEAEAKKVEEEKAKAEAAKSKAAVVATPDPRGSSHAFQPEKER